MIYLHIGKHKTGTSSIQKYLYANRIELQEKGFYYPSACIRWFAHHNLFYQFTQDSEFGHLYDDLNGSFEALINEIQSYVLVNSKADIIISAEGLCALDFPQLEMILLGLVAINPVTIIFGLRRQDYFLRSWWSMLVYQLKEKRSFIDFVSSVDYSYLKLDYFEYVSRIKEMRLGIPIVLLPYSERQNNAVDLFCRTLGVPASMENRPQRANKSLDFLTLEMIRSLKEDDLSQLGPKKQQKVIQSIKKYSELRSWSQYSDESEAILTDEFYYKIKQEFEKSNHELIVSYPKLKSCLHFENENLSHNEISLDALPSIEFLKLSLYLFKQGIKLGRSNSI